MSTFSHNRNSIRRYRDKRGRGLLGALVMWGVCVMALGGMFYMIHSLFFGGDLPAPVQASAPEPYVSAAPVKPVENKPVPQTRPSVTERAVAVETLPTPPLPKEAVSQKRKSIESPAEVVEAGSGAIDPWGVQIGVFRQEKYAKTLGDKARKAGFDALVVRTISGSRDLFRVRVNAPGENEARSIEKALLDGGFEALVCFGG